MIEKLKAFTFQQGLLQMTLSLLWDIAAQGPVPRPCDDENIILVCELKKFPEIHLSQPWRANPCKGPKIYAKLEIRLFKTIVN
jgi:hypothetical protein